MKNENKKNKGIGKGVILKPEIIELVDKIRERTGDSFSSFVKRCIIEKLERLSLITSSIKAEMQKEVI